MSPSCRSDKSKPSFYAAVPDPCDNCRFTTCFSLHTYSALSCPYNLCPECRELELLDAQIAVIHNLLVNLSQKRHDLKGRINRRHDRLTSRLPLEVISHIFTFFTEETESQSPEGSFSLDRYRCDAVLRLGAVCRRWRDITLGTPQLWTKVNINPETQGCFPQITEQWLSRSRALPLRLKVNLPDKRAEYQMPTLSTIFGLLRSHASRWRHLILCSPLDMLNDILGGIENITVESLAIENGGVRKPVNMDGIAMKYPFVPKDLYFWDVPISIIPLHFDRLTQLTAHYIEVDELLFIFQSARHLQECTLEVVPEENGDYPMPSSPISNNSMKVLDTWMDPDAFNGTHLYFLTHLALPSLETLRYSGRDRRWELDQLAHFVDRSKPPLKEFHLRYFDRDRTLDIDWYLTLSSITSLDLEIESPDDDNGPRTREYIQGLSAYLEPMALPCLREFSLTTFRMCPGAWNDLLDIFPDHENQNEPAPVGPRPLKTVSIHLNRSFEMSRMFPKDVYYHLRTIQESGVAITVSVRDRMVNVFGPDVKVVPYTYEDCSDGDTSGNEMEGEEFYVEVEGASGEESSHADEASSENGIQEEGTDASIEDGSELELDEE